MQVAASTVSSLVLLLLSVLHLSLSDPVTFVYEGKELTCKDVIRKDKGTDICEVLQECPFSNKNSCHDAVLIADENGDTLEAKSIAVAVGKHYVLSTVSSNFPKFFEENRRLFVIKDKKTYLLRDANVIPRMIPGNFDAHGWHDLLLIELPNGQAFEGNSFVKISRTVPTETTIGDFFCTHESQTARFHSNLTVHKIKSCKKEFKNYPLLIDDRHFACRLDGHFNSTSPSDVEKLLLGAPFYVETVDKRRYLAGMRSFLLTTKWFLVTKLAPYCDWIEATSYGEVKCVD